MFGQSAALLSTGVEAVPLQPAPFQQLQNRWMFLINPPTCWHRKWPIQSEKSIYLLFYTHDGTISIFNVFLSLYILREYRLSVNMEEFRLFCNTCQRLASQNHKMVSCLRENQQLRHFSNPLGFFGHIIPAAYSDWIVINAEEPWGKGRCCRSPGGKHRLQRTAEVYEDEPGSYLFLGLLFEVIDSRCRLSHGGLGAKCGFVGRRSRQRVVVVIGQAGALSGSVGLLLKPRRRGPQLPPPFLAQCLSGFVDRVHPIVVGVRRFRVVILHLTDVCFIASNRGTAKHVGNLKKS